MKVDQYTPSVQSQRSEETAKTAEAPSSAPQTSRVVSAADTLSLSTGVEFVRAAVERASAQPDIRPDVVQRMRELIDKGELGQDAERLADALIDRWLTEP